MKNYFLVIWVLCMCLACSFNNSKKEGELSRAVESTEVSFKIPLMPNLDWEITQSWAEHCEYCEEKYPYDPTDPKDTTYCNSSHSTDYHSGKGWDFNEQEGADEGSEVLASADGSVYSIGYDTVGWGQYVVVDHGGNICTRYAHMRKDDVPVEEGQYVCQGLVLGYVAGTPRWRPHLHFQFEKCDTQEPLAMGFTDGNGIPKCLKKNDIYDSAGNYIGLIRSNVRRTECDNATPVGNAKLPEGGWRQVSCGALEGCPLSSACGREAGSHKFEDDESLNERVARAADYLYSECAVDGKSDGAIHPHDTITRAEALKIPMKLFGLVQDDCKSDDVPFTDVDTDDWYYEVVACAVSEGVINSADEFRPNSKVNFAEAAKMAVETAVKSGKVEIKESSEQHFPKISEDHWSYPYAETLYAYGGIVDLNTSPAADMERGDYMIMVASMSPCFCDNVQCDTGCSCLQKDFACMDPNDTQPGEGGGGRSHEVPDLRIECETDDGAGDCEDDDYIFMARCTMKNRGEETVRVNNFFAEISDADDRRDCEMVDGSTADGGVGTQNVEPGDERQMPGGFRFRCDEMPSEGEISVEFDLVTRNDGETQRYNGLIETELKVERELMDSCREDNSSQENPPANQDPPHEESPAESPPANNGIPLAGRDANGNCNFEGLYRLYVYAEDGYVDVLTGTGETGSYLIPSGQSLMLAVECYELPLAVLAFSPDIPIHAAAAEDSGVAARLPQFHYWAPYDTPITTWPGVGATGLSNDIWIGENSVPVLFGVGF